MRKFKKKKVRKFAKKVLKCEENVKKKTLNVRKKRPKFYKKHRGATAVGATPVAPLCINFRNYNVLRRSNGWTNRKLNCKSRIEIE